LSAVGLRRSDLETAIKTRPIVTLSLPSQIAATSHPSVTYLQSIMSSNDSQSLDGIVQQITTTTNFNTLLQTLRTALPKEARDVILASSLSSGQDPLSVLDVRENTLGVLYILCVYLFLIVYPAS
jgi:hypothetical protein